MSRTSKTKPVANDASLKSRARPGRDPKAHARKIEEMLTQVIEHAREDIELIDDTKARVLFETTAEVLIGLRTAYWHYGSGTEKAMS
jgi:hypothetical protein